MHTNTGHAFLGTPLGILALSVVLWCVVLFAVSIFSGWQALHRFAKHSEPLGETHSAGPWFYQVYMRNWARYGGVVRATAASDALYLSVFPVFRFAHPPLRIPWSEISFGRTRRLWRNYVVLTLGSEERVPMRISERMARKLQILDRCPALEPVAASR